MSELERILDEAERCTGEPWPRTAWDDLYDAVYAECARHGLILDDPPASLCMADPGADPIEVAREVMWWASPICVEVG